MTMDATHCLRAKIQMAHTNMHCATGSFVRGGGLNNEDAHRLRTIRAYCDQLLSGKRPKSNLDAAAEAYDEAMA